MDLPDHIEQLLAPTVEALGFHVVRVQITGKHKPVLQIMVEHIDETSMTVDECAKISRTVSAVLDVEDSVRETYTLEVSSPGIDRPLVRLRDFERFSGYEAKVEMARPLEGRRRFRGRLLGVVGDAVCLQVEGADVELPYQDIVRAKLIMNDDLLAPLLEQ